MRIDTKNEATRVESFRPYPTPKITPGSTEITTGRRGSAVGLSGSVGFPSTYGTVSGHVGTSSSSYLVETRNYGTRITQGESDGKVWWGFNIDDLHEREAGKDLHDILPRVELVFMGDNASLPEQLHVEVASFWSLVPTSGKTPNPNFR